MTSRLPVRALDASGYIGDGAQALHDDGTWKIPAGGGGGGLPAGGTTGQVLTKLSATDGDAGWATPSGGSGSGGSVRDLRWVCPAALSSLDEFNDDNLTGFTAVNAAGAAAANIEWVEQGDVLSANTLGGDSTGALHAQVRSIGSAMVAGDALVTCMQVWGPAATYTMGGLALSDSASAAGTQIVGLIYQGTGQSIDLWQTSSWAGASVIAGNRFGNIEVKSPIHVRLVYLGGTSWRLDISPNGIHWRKSATSTKAITPTHVGVIGSSWGTATQGILSYEYLRRQAGVS